MKKRFKIFLIVALVLFFLPIKSEARPRGIRTSGYVSVNTNWKNIATADYGFGCNIEVESMSANLGNNSTVLGLDVRMLDKKGNVLWSQSEAVPGWGKRVFWCGKDVYKIQVRYNRGIGSAASTYISG